MVFALLVSVLYTLSLWHNNIWKPKIKNKKSDVVKSISGA